ERGEDVVRREGRAVVELDAGAQLEAPGHRIDLLPGHGKLRDQIQLLVAADQELVYEMIDVVGQALVLRVRVGRLRIAAVGPAQCSGVCGADGKCRDNEG